MIGLDAVDLGDRLHRLVKIAMDTGEAASVEEAQKIFSAYRLGVSVGPDALNFAPHQAALLTIINAGTRSLLGGIEVQGLTADAPLLVPLPGSRTLAEAVVALGGRIVVQVAPDIPLAVLGDVPSPLDAHPLTLRVTFGGWSGGVAPLSAGVRLAERDALVLAGVVAGALTVTEVFQYLRGSNTAAGRRQVGLSLWRPELNWRDPLAAGPRIERLPSAAWLIGLGNLGQAYLWALSLLPYDAPGEVNLVLQDFDVLAKSNESTSLLTTTSMLHKKKTRAMAAWAERRGFNTAIVERRFTADFRVSPDEPPVALCGVDNALARAALEDVGFGRVIEAGLGKGTSDFLAFRMHCFPGPRGARDLWNDAGAGTIEGSSLELPAYRALAATGIDRCGLTSLAGRTVGAPFVGGLVATLVIAELLRIVNGGHSYDFIDGHLRSLAHRTVSPAIAPLEFNPGSTAALL